jgi:hypothetical protein
MLLKAGDDVSREYHAIHEWDADEIKEYYCIGIAVDDQLLPIQVPASLRKVGNTLKMKEPTSHIIYHGRGYFFICASCDGAGAMLTLHGGGGGVLP